MDDWDEIQLDFIGTQAAREVKGNMYGDLLYTMDKLGMVEDLKRDSIFWSLKYSTLAYGIRDEE